MARANVLGFFFVVSLCLFLALGTVSFVFAAAPPTLIVGCPKGSSTGDPTTGTPKIFSVSQITGLKSYLQKVIYCTNVCYNVRVSVTMTKDASGASAIGIRTVAVNKCKVQDQPEQDTPQRGCAKGQIQPTIISDVPAIKAFGSELVAAQTIGPKSRCDGSISSIVGSMLGRSENNDLSGYKNDLAALQGLPSQASPTSVTPPPAEINTSTLAGQKVLAEQLATAFKIPVEQAQPIVAKDPQAALRAIYAVAQGDDVAIKAEAAALDLNPNLTDRVALNARLIRDGSLTDPNQTSAPGAAPDTFRDVADAVPQVLSRDVLYSGQGTCYAVSNSYGTFRPCVLTQDQVSQVQGNIIPQVASVYWEGSRTANGEAFNPNGLTVASQTLPFGTQVLIYNPNTGLGVVATVNDRGPFVSGRDIDLSRGAANAIGFNGVGIVQTVVLGSSMPTGSLGQFSSVADAFQAYQKSNGTIAVGDGKIEPTFTRNTSPFVGLSSPSTIGYANTSSPFANTSPIPITQPPYSPAPVNPVSQSIAQPINPISGQTTSGSSTVADQLIEALQGGKGGSGQPTMTLLTEPKTVTRGNPIMVSWSTIGMSTAKPCAMRAGETLIAQKNAGSSVVPTGPSTRLGSLVFTLQCTLPTGETIQRTAATFVQ